MDRLGMEEGEPIEHKLVTRAIGTAQKRVETHNFEIRKHLLEYDDVMNKQREIVYGLRREVLAGESQEETVLEWIGELVGVVVARYAGPEAHQEDWDMVGLNEALHRQFDFRMPDLKVDDIASHDALVEQVTEAAEAHYRRREGEMGGEMFHRLERWIILGLEWEGGGFRGINQLWREHLLNMDHLKEGIGLRGYGQRDPLTEYKKEAFDMFQEMIGSLKETAVEQLFKVRMTQEDAPTTRVAQRATPEWQESRGGDLDSAQGRPATARTEPRAADGQKVGRNDPCHCGSGKKYKKCCLLKGA
jgi:preprotein translocase subunit SecA